MRSLLRKRWRMPVRRWTLQNYFFHFQKNWEKTFFGYEKMTCNFLDILTIPLKIFWNKFYI